MAYGRKRSAIRRKGRRGNRSLSTRRIFNNKSAKAQAAQIYALRKSVSRVRRQCRPEIKERTTDFSFSLGKPVDGTSLSRYNISAIQFPYQGDSDVDRVGNLIKLLPMRYRLSMQYREDSTSGQFSQLPTSGMQVRIFAIQLKTSSANYPGLSDILDNYSLSDANISTLTNMTAAFRKGITAKYNIIFNKVFSLSKDKPCVTRSLVMNPSIRSVRWEENVTYPRGQIIIYVLQGGANSNEYSEADIDYNAVDVRGNLSLPYTDA